MDISKTVSQKFAYRCKFGSFNEQTPNGNETCNDYNGGPCFEEQVYFQSRNRAEVYSGKCLQV